MNKRLLLCVFLLVGSNGYAEDEMPDAAVATHYRGFSIALHKCHDFSKREKEESFIRAYKIWFGGYLTAINYLLEGKEDAINGGNLDDVIGWLSSYCMGNSEAYISEAATDMIIYFDEQRTNGSETKLK